MSDTPEGLRPAGQVRVLTRGARPGPAVRGAADPGQAAGRLIEAANAGGGPDNVSCVVADIIPSSGR